MDKKLLRKIGNTPIKKLSRYSANKKVEIIAKLEGENPTGSIKDRIAYYIIKKAIKDKKLLPGMIIIEATSGNTGISLAAISKIFGYQFIAVMPDNVTLERRKMIKLYGGKLILTKDGKDIQTAKKIVKDNPHNYFFVDQFNNEDNVKANYQTLGKEILKQVPDITHFIAGIGTSGTITGVGKRLKENNSNIKIIGLDPQKNTIIQGLRNLEFFQPKIFSHKYVDQIINVANNNHYLKIMKELLTKENLSVGISSAAAFSQAINLSEIIKKGVIVVVFPDRGDRYLSLL